MYKYIFILITVVTLVSFITRVEDKAVVQSNIDAVLLTDRKIFEVGETIILEFEGGGMEIPSLYCTYSYGSTVIDYAIEEYGLMYEIPEIVSEKAGEVYWNLLGTNLSGHFTITPKKKVSTLETYIGPPSIAAGDDDYTMLVVIPTDVLDNPLTDSTEVTIQHQFQNSITTSQIFMDNLIAYKNLYATKKTGRMLIGTSSLGIHSKEYDIAIMPSIPTNFTISAARHHEYADGNQITTFSTSVIKDAYGNVVNDGTYVNFFVTNQEGNILKTSGTTIRGIAKASMIHPDQETTWKIKAFIEGLAESNAIALAYKQIIDIIPVTVSNTVITIGPLQSFMEQMVPDGFLVSLQIYKEEQRVYVTNKGSKKGYVDFDLNDFQVPSGIYRIVIETAGIQKTLPSVQL